MVRGEWVAYLAQFNQPGRDEEASQVKPHALLGHLHLATPSRVQMSQSTTKLSRENL